jgi:hypothetical protein
MTLQKWTQFLVKTPAEKISPESAPDMKALVWHVDVSAKPDALLSQYILGTGLLVKSLKNPK